METLELNISNMGSQHCMTTVKSAIEPIDGVKEISLVPKQATIVYDNSKIKKDQIISAITSAGYNVVTT